MGNVLPRSTLEVLAEKRERARHKLKGKNMTFDCYHARLIHKDGELRVQCDTGRRITDNSGDGSAFIAQVLRGGCFSNCQGCGDFDAGNEKGG